MAGPYWEHVREVVEKKGRELRKYTFFERVWETLDAGSDLVLLEAPTGCGKTEATTVPFMAKLAGGEPSWASLIYVLPTRSLVRSMRNRLSNALKALNARYSTVVVDHGELWSMRPYLEGDLTITTYDTFLYTFYGFRSPGYHLLLPVGKVALSLVIMDEAQLLQDTSWFSMKLLPYHIRCLLEFGSQVVMMTATMPPPLKEELLRRCKKKNVEIIEAGDKPHRGTIEVGQREGALPTDRAGLSALLKEISCDAGLPLLVVVNKVSKAVQIYERLKELSHEGHLPEQADVMLLHSRLRRGWRNEVEEALERRGHEEHARLILVATQVVEAGLDYNFSTLLTELSPVDSLIQRVGRLARRPGSQGKAVIFLDTEAGKGVYPRQVIERTLSAITGRDELLAKAPSDIKASSELLSDVYTKGLVDELVRSAGVLGLLREVMSFIERFKHYLAFPRPEEGSPKREALLRLGVEVRCWWAGREATKALIAEKTLNITIQEFENNLLSLSVVRRPGDIMAIPAAIRHESMGKEVLVKLSIERDERGVLRIRGKAIELDPHRFLREVKEGLFLLNPDYYELSEAGEELGVIQPW